jgi:hypothetical protein
MNLADLPERYQRQAQTQLGHAAFVPHTACATLPIREVKKGKRLRQKEGDGMNKTERAFKAWLDQYVVNPGDALIVQSVTLKIANGCRYTPDFLTLGKAAVPEGEADAFNLHAYEVKGFMRDDAAVKIKVAASLYPWIRFTLATKDGDAWQLQDIAA